jgi:lysine-specific demethylase/histidyl-hydroxylase NO66
VPASEKNNETDHETFSGSHALALCVGNVAEFMAQAWGRRTWLHHSPMNNDILDLDDIDRLFEVSLLRVPHFRLVSSGHTIPPSSYMTTDGRRPNVPEAVADTSAVLHLFSEGVPDREKVAAAIHSGATLILQGVHRYHPPLARLCRMLELELGHPCQANAYITPPEAQGLPVHQDPHGRLRPPVQPIRSCVTARSVS